MNEADSELLAGILAGGGHHVVAGPGDAEVVLLNTCAVRESAERRVFGRLAELKALKSRRPGVIIGVCGCMARHLRDAILERAPYVDFLAGPDSYRRLPEIIESVSGEPALDLRLDRRETYAGLDRLRSEGVSAWVTVMRGCDKFCSFCVVPYVRGRERSVPSGEVIRQVERLARDGVKEVTLLGQTVNSYSCNGVDFADLLVKTASVKGIARVRFTAPHPTDFGDKLIDAIASVPAICRHVHLPVQSGSDEVLRRMRRGYTSSRYLALVEKLRAAVPGVALSTDILVGFPGETEEDYRATYDMMRRVRFDFAFTFRYSPREGTTAHRRLADDVPGDEKGRRLSEVIDLQEDISRQINAALIGDEVEVLVEGESRRGSGQLFGKTGTFKTTVFADTGVPVGSIVAVGVERATSHTLIGRVSGQETAYRGRIWPEAEAKI